MKPRRVELEDIRAIYVSNDDGHTYLILNCGTVYCSCRWVTP